MFQTFGFQRAFEVIGDMAELTALAAFIAMIGMVARLLGA